MEPGLVSVAFSLFIPICITDRANWVFQGFVYFLAPFSNFVALSDIGACPFEKSGFSRFLKRLGFSL